jgi:competence protein ComEC
MMHQHPFHAPLLLPAASLAAGIAVGMPLGAVEVLCLLVGAIVAALFLGRWPFWQSAALGAGFLLLGMLLSPADEPRVADGTWTEAVVASAPAQRPKTIMAELLLPATGERRRCYLWSDERSQQLHVGQNLMVRIHDGQFIGRSDWRPGGDAFNHATSLQRLRIRALQWRGRLLERYRSMEGDDEAQAVLAAMVLGDKSALTRDLRQTYSSSGASHVLALSGPHLSIIYLLLSRHSLHVKGWYFLCPVVVTMCGLLSLMVPSLRESVSTVVLMTGICLLLFNFTSLQEYLAERRGRRPVAQPTDNQIVENSPVAVDDNMIESGQ